MSLNDVYSIKYTPDPRSEALEYIDSVLHETEEKVRSAVRHECHIKSRLRIWKEIHAKLTSGEYNEMMANNSLRRDKLPLLEDDYEPSLDNLVQWRVQSVPLKMDYNLLSAIRDACGK